ncbi:cell wall hydrolase [Cytobacillus gottheilii]|uniref:cell wall hydrolase n=1 Tax=Cytobacillus gottheilii TaxID=859144 RepID=UPI0009BAD137|nr:cell wall hydrolase [Cytobacillus gottheilii]
MKKFVLSLIAALVMVSFHYTFAELKGTNAETLDSVTIYNVKDQETLYDVALKFSVSELELKEVNHLSSEAIHSGDKLIIPNTISKKEIDLLARLVHAEAKGEPYKGKVAVAQVVLNRVEDERFPDSIKQVIYEKRQFQPVDNGSIDKPADKEAKKAVNEAIALEGQGNNEAVYFFNPDLTDSNWLRSQTVTGEIGKHRFAK